MEELMRDLKSAAAICECSGAQNEMEKGVAAFS